MKYFVVALFGVLIVIWCGEKMMHHGITTDGKIAVTNGAETGQIEEVATTVVFKKFPMNFELPVNPSADDLLHASQTNVISHVSDKLLASGILRDSVGFLKDPLYNNWRTVGPMHSPSGVASLIEAKFKGPQPFYFRYEYAEGMMMSGRYYNLLGFHDLVNLVAKYGDKLPPDVPIVALGSVTAYRSFVYEVDMNIVQSPTVIKRDGKWELFDFRIIHDGFSPEDHAPLFLVDLNCKVDRDNPAPRSSVKIFLYPGDVR